MTDKFDIFVQLMALSMSKINKLILERQADIVLKKKEDGDLTRNIDKIVEDGFIKKLREIRLPVTLITEETGVINLSGAPHYALFLDPVDGSDMAARGYPLCSIAMTLFDLDKMKSEISLIGDLGRNKMFCAYDENAFIYKNNCEKIPIKVASYKPLEECMMVCYAAKPARLIKIFEQKELFEKIGLFLNYGGPMDIARVGEGTVDTFLEFQKGFKSIDYIAGIDIAEKAGAIVTDLQGNPLNVKIDLESRQKFLVSANKEIHNQILEFFKYIV